MIQMDSALKTACNILVGIVASALAWMLMQIVGWVLILALSEGGREVLKTIFGFIGLFLGVAAVPLGWFFVAIVLFTATLIGLVKFFAGN